MKETAITASHISKEYTLDYSRTNSFKELLTRRILRKHKLSVDGCKKVHALQDISFEVNKGEALGIIGKNGAGKSTLLKVLSGITKPTSGQIEIFGRMSSILDIGVGFHPELSGRENVFLSGELNGLSRKDIKGRLDEIIDFSGVEKFIDTPVKYYSSGMFLRLAFSVFTGIDSEILLLDEVMSVGDAEFQMRSYKKLQSMFGQGKTIVLVSHNPSDIVKLCSRVIILDEGKIKEEGVPAKVVVDYMEESILEAMESPGKKNLNNWNKSEETTKSQPTDQQKLRSFVQWSDILTSPGNEYFRLTKVEIKAEGKTTGSPMFINDKLIVEITYWKKNADDVIDIALTLNHFGSIIFGSSTMLVIQPDEMKMKGNLVVQMFIPPNLLNNTIYSIDIYAIKDKKNIILNESEILHFTMEESDNVIVKSVKDTFQIFPGIIRPEFNWTVSNKLY